MYVTPADPFFAPGGPIAQVFIAALQFMIGIPNPPIGSLLFLVHILIRRSQTNFIVRIIKLFYALQSHCNRTVDYIGVLIFTIIMI